VTALSQRAAVRSVCTSQLLAAHDPVRAAHVGEVVEVEDRHAASGGEHREHGGLPDRAGAVDRDHRLDA